jgi:hypothetical protein
MVWCNVVAYFVMRLECLVIPVMYSYDDVYQEKNEVHLKSLKILNSSQFRMRVQEVVLNFS